MPPIIDTAAENRRRLEHLRSMPESPSRKREILSLERALSQAPAIEAQKRLKASSRTSRAKRSELDSPETDKPEPEQPRRSVEDAGTHRRVLVRAKRNSKDDPAETTRDKSAREAIDGIRSMLGLEHRGMS